LPKVIQKAAWEKSFREEVSGLCRGWNVKQKNGKVFLRVRTQEKESSVYLPFQWQKAQKTAAMNRVQAIYREVKTNKRDLQAAAKVAAGEAPQSISECNWVGALEKFKKQKMEFGTTIKPITWKDDYQAVLTHAVTLLTSDSAPTSPEDLIDACVAKWVPGSSARKSKTGALVQFLKYCVNRGKFSPTWAPPSDISTHIGRKPANAESRKGDPITDQQIINLINSCPDTEAGRKWADVLRLLSELGIRPVELNYLSVRKDPKTGEPYWWCSYKKRAGKGSTEARQVYPLPLISDDGEVQKWNLLERMQAGLFNLPNMKDKNQLKNYLNRRESWISLKKDLKAKDENVVPYSFRHAYSLRGHLRGIDNGSMATSMGHSIETHCSSYAWASQSTTEDAFKRANKELVAA
tara:strand:+ start:624 stop:1844 length:1221 start_codon:yes stop_codon:yes gene_type:complete